jgi:hypothetical protein
MARQHKETVKPVKERYTAHGISISYMENRKKANEMKINEMKERIGSILKNAYDSDCKSEYGP